MVIFGVLFTLLALFHAAEIAITTLYPWKVREFAEEEGGMWLALDSDITRVLTTILVSSTAAGIYATTIFGKVAASYGPKAERYAALGLTVLTLFFVELLPKSIGVGNAEMVARKMVPPIRIMGYVVSPLGTILTGAAKRVLGIFGFSSGGMELVSEEEVSEEQGEELLCCDGIREERREHAAGGAKRRLPHIIYIYIVVGGMLLSLRSSPSLQPLLPSFAPRPHPFLLTAAAPHC